MSRSVHGGSAPRLRAAFAFLTADPVCWAYKAKADQELKKGELQKRIAELASRRREQTAEVRAMNTAAAGGGGAAGP